MWKIAALCAGLSAAAIGALAFFTVVLPWRNKITQQKQLVGDLVNAMAPQILRRTATGLRIDPYQLDALIQTAASGARRPFHVEILYVLVRDAQGHVDPAASRIGPSLATSLPTSELTLHRADPAEFFRRLLATRIGQTRRLELTLKAKGDPDLRLDFGLGTSAIDRELREGLYRDGLVLALALLFAIGGSVLIGGRIGRPLSNLSAAMGRLREGDFEVRSEATKRRDEVGDLARSFNEMAVGLKERERLRGTLGRYVSGDVAERILAETDDLSLQGELRRVTVLFLDIRGFTSVSERLQPHEVVELLNSYFHVVVDRVTAHGGSVNKFIGDAAMCIWGAPRAVAAPERKAVLCALDIQRDAGRLSAERTARGAHTVGIGIGINSGEVVAGNLGASRRLEYTVIGDAVNLAQRLESQARPGEVLISQPVFEAVADFVEALPREPVKLKGKAQPVPLWDVKGLKQTATEAA